jgi:protein SCO1/2
MKSPLRTTLIVLAAAGFVLIVVLASVLLRPYRYHGTELRTPQPAKDFTLTGPDGKPVKLSDFQGKLVVLYFGYTHCPDVCPTTLADLARAMEKLGKKADQVQVVMVTVDPDRDTAEHMAEYVDYFNPTFVGLSGTPDEIAAAAAAYGIYYHKNEGTPASGYTVDHTATMTVLDEEGRVRLFWPFGTPADDMAADLAHLLG